jgi:hypothetical protein
VDDINNVASDVGETANEKGGRRGEEQGIIMSGRVGVMDGERAHYERRTTMRMRSIFANLFISHFLFTQQH